MILYNMKENMMLIQKEKAFLEICRELDIPVKKLEPGDMARQVADLTGMEAPFPLVQQQIPMGAELPEMLIFSGVENGLLDQFLASYRKKGLAPIALKAIVTPFNVSWSLYQLIKELEKEAETMKQYRKTK
ncbi:MAG: DUF3783 domain-containing protein [Lachnospiraceae bacterium]